MAVDLKKVSVNLEKAGITKRTGVLLVVLILVVAGYCFLGITEESPPMATQVAVGKTGDKNSPGVVPEQTRAAAIQSVPAVSTVRDPFQVPPAYRKSDKSGLTEKVDTRADVSADNPSNNTANNSAKPVELPQLRGTVIGDSDSTAIVALGTESRAVRVGGIIGDYKLVAVNANSVVLAGPSGSITLWMRR